MDAWYVKARKAGLGLITGAVSHGLECTEFDDRAAYVAYKEAAISAGLGELVERIEAGYSEESPSGGIHWFYFCEMVDGNTKLARRPKTDEEKQHPKDNVKALIETRGEGGYVIVAPSGGRVHPSGKSYVALAGTLATITTLTPTERIELHRLARTLDELPPPVELPQERRREEQQGRPGDDFNRRADWTGILTPHGWARVFARGPVTYWRRPGKKQGISASTNHAGSGLFYVFSSSTGFEPERGYSPFAVYSMLEHGGNFADSAKRLAADGYGDKKSDEGPTEVRFFPWTDAGNAELFVHLYGDRVLYDWAQLKFFLWQRHRWEPDPDGEMYRLSLMVARERQRAAADIEDKASATELFKYGRGCEAVAKIDSMLKSLRWLPAVKDRGTNWDANPTLLGVENGVVSLTGDSMRPGRQEDRISKTVGINYDPRAKCPRWDRFLLEIFEGNVTMVEFVQRAVGYSLTGMMSEQVWFLLHGSGSNGKSTFVDTLLAMMGDYGADTPADTLCAKPGLGGPVASPELAALQGKRLVTCQETEEAAKLNAGRVKWITGGNPITARFLHANYVTFTPSAKLWLTTNRLPVVEDDSDGFWRRVRLIPFNAKFEGNDRQLDLEDELKRELPGILAWAVRGAVEWAKVGLKPPAEVMLATLKYRQSSDPIREFISDRCYVGENARATRGQLYAAYRDWAKAQGYGDKDMLTALTFGRRVAERWENVSRHGMRYYLGIGVNASESGDVFNDPDEPFVSTGDVSGGEKEKSAGQTHARAISPENQPKHVTASPSNNQLVCDCDERHPDDLGECAELAWLPGPDGDHCPRHCQGFANDKTE